MALHACFQMKLFQMIPFSFLGLKYSLEVCDKCVSKSLLLLNTQIKQVMKTKEQFKRKGLVYLSSNL